MLRKGKVVRCTAVAYGTAWYAEAVLSLLIDGVVVAS
jgi:hypothetical protein